MKRKIIRLVLICLIILGIVAAIAVLCFERYIDYSKDYQKVLSVQGENKDVSKAQHDNIQKDITEITATEKRPVLEDKTGIVNILFLGIDRTENRDKTIGVYRTDTISLASVDLNTKKINVLSIPRDTYVFIPSINKKDKINHAYVWGGMKEEGIKSTIETVNRFIKYAKVDYYFAVDMEPVPEIIDALGGIELDVEVEVKNKRVDLKKGLQLLNGEQAFEYIHWRYSGNGDIDRVKRQQKLIKAMFSKISKSGNMLDAVNIVLRYRKYIQTNLATAKIIALAELYKDIKNDNIKFYDVPGHNEYIDNVWFWVSDEAETDKKLKEAFINER